MRIIEYFVVAYLTAFTSAVATLVSGHYLVSLWLVFAAVVFVAAAIAWDINTLAADSRG